MKYLHFIVFLILGVASVALCGCTEEVANLSGNDTSEKGSPEDYCLMFYIAGGDFDHDLSFMSAVKMAEDALAEYPDLAVTVLFKGSGAGEGEEHNGVRRFYSSGGKLREDTSFSAPEDFRITDPDNLTDFLFWTSQIYRNRCYMLAYCGHGFTWYPADGFDTPAGTRGSLADNGVEMGAPDMAEAIRLSGVHLTAMIAHSCLQGSIEMLAEWEGLTDYLLGSPFMDPDICFDYYSLLSDLAEGRSVEETLTRTCRRTMNVWQGFHDNGVFDTVIQATRLSDLSSLWEVLHELFAVMREELDTENRYTTDPPAIFGETYREAYGRALDKVLKYNTNDFDTQFRMIHSMELANFLRNALIHSGNMRMLPYVNRLQDVIDEITVCHLQSNGKDDYYFNVFAGPGMYEETMIEYYRTCRFDRLTGWSDLYLELPPVDMTEFMQAS